MRVNGMRSVFSFSAVCSAARMSINLLDAVVFRLNDRNRIATFIEKLIFPKNQSRHYINDEG